MSEYNQYFFHTKDGVIGGYRSLMALHPSLKIGIFMVISTGGPGYAMGHTLHCQWVFHSLCPSDSDSCMTRFNLIVPVATTS